jgi:hypothetical protein
MAKLFKWLVFLALGLLLLLAAVIFMLQHWVSTDDFRQRVEREAAAALGVPVTLDHVAVDVWPLPAVALSGIVVQSKPAIALARVEVRPQWQPMLQGRLVVATLLVRHAVLPQQGIDAVLLALQKKKQIASAVPAAPIKQGQPPQNIASPAPEQGGPGDLLPRHTVLDDVSWLSATGARTTLEGELRLGDDGLPDSASLKLLKGNLQGLAATLKRQEKAGFEQGSAAAAGAGQWALRVAVGGGTVEGLLDLQRSPVTASAASSRTAAAGAELVLQGQLQTRGVEVSALTAPNKPLTGRLEASTTLRARAATTSALVEALQTRTTFTVRKAVLNSVDLAKAVQTVGLSRGGQTALDTLSGQLNSQGQHLQLSNLVASSGALSATGGVALSPARALSGKLAVNVAGDSKIGTALGGAVGVPLTVGGTLDNPELTLSRSALLGAAVGTALMPGVGTAAGANLGERLRGLFGK